MLDHIFNKPLLMEPVRAQMLINRLISSDEILDQDALMGEFRTNAFSPTLIDGVMVIPILGTLVNRRSSVGFFGGDISHQEIATMLLDAAADNSVHAILLDIDSGGGEANGVFDLAETIREIDTHIPVFAIANDAAFSGAFAIGSAARKVFVTRTGGVGSIGVIAHHVDISESLKQAGIKVTQITAGDLKGELSPIQPLTEEAQARVQAEVDKTFDLFVDVVAEHRGLSRETIISTQAGLFFGSDAVGLKLADQVASFDEAMSQILNMQEDRMNTFQKVNKTEVADEEADVTAQEDEIKKKTEEDSVKASEEKTKDVSEHEEEEDEKTGSDGEEKGKVVHATAVEISQMALKAGCSSMIPSLLAEPLTVEQVEEKLQVSEKIIDLCAKAGCPKKSDKYIEDGVAVVDVQEELINFMARASAKHDVSSKVDADGIDNDTIKEYASNDKGINPLVADAEKRHADFQTHYKGAE